MPWYPSFDQTVPRTVVEAVRRAFDEMYRLRERADAVDRAAYLPKVDASVLYGASALRQALQTAGRTPLNVTGLPGQLSQPQKAYVPFVSALPDVLHDPMSQNGALVSFNGVVYWFDGRTEPGRWRVLGAAAVFLTDTHANRVANYPASDYPIGTVFWESDRTVLYENQGVYGASNWVYILGTMHGLQAAIAGLGLGQYDDGFLFHCTDYEHVLRWVWGGGPGAFTWGPAENGSGFIQMFAVAPTGVGWKLADGTGSPVTYLLATGATAAVAVPDLTAGVYPKGAAAYTGVVSAAVDPVIAGDTADENAHTHGGGTLDAAAESGGTPSGTIGDAGAHGHTGDTAGASADTVVAGTGATVASAVNHTHSLFIDPAADHSHSFTGDPLANHDHAISGDTGAGSAHKHGAGTLTATGGQPSSIDLLPYFRQ